MVGLRLAVRRRLPGYSGKVGHQRSGTRSYEPARLAGVETLSTKKGTLVAVAGTGVVGLDDGQLVLGGERPSPRLVGQGRTIFSHHLIMGALHQLGWHGHCCLPGPVSPLRDGGVPQVSQVMLTERGSTPWTCR